MNKKSIIFNIAGGAGKNIMATSVVAQIRKTYPKDEIIISTPWKIIWENNPDVNKVINPEEVAFFYRDYVKDKDVKIFKLDPYNADDYFYRRRHLIEIWTSLCGIKYKKAEPKLYFTDEEEKTVKEKLGLKEGKDNRPLFFIQASGGPENQPYPISWARDLPLSIAEEVVKKMNEKGYRTIQIKRNNQVQISGAEYIPFTLRESLCALKFSEKRLLVDSIFQHACAALGLPAVVVWIVNDPKVFGYDIHTNLFPELKEEFRHHPNSYLEQYNISGVWSEHPYKTDGLFSAGKILKALL